MTDGRGRLDAVPGCPEPAVPEVASSVFCELNITERAGSKLSSLSSPEASSQSTVTPA